MFVLGIDPGVSRCGYCVVERTRRRSRAVALGVLTTSPSDALPRRLAEIQTEVVDLLEEFGPSVVAVERVLFQVNVRTAMSVGQASGIVMAAAAARGAEVVEYSPNEVKQAVCGHGGADKEQVQRMVRALLDLDVVPRPPDAADAAAVALCHLARAPLSGAAGRASTARPSHGDPTAVRRPEEVST